MSASISSETQLLAEHFGYPPVSLLDDIINSINILAEQALNGVEKALLGTKPASLGFRDQQPPPPPAKSKRAPPPPPPPPAATAEEAHRHEIENGTHQLETLLCASIDRNFDIFELYVMRNILTVRPDHRDWIRLSHYEGLDFAAAARRRKGVVGGSGATSAEGVSAVADGQGGGNGPVPVAAADENGSSEDVAMSGEVTDHDTPSIASVARLRRRLQASQKLNVMLHAERARNAALLDELRTFLHGSGGADGSGATAGGAATVKSESGAGGQDGTAAAPSLGFLRNKGELTVSDAETPLTTTTAFTLSQLQALRALSTSLRTMMPDLGQHKQGRGGDGSTDDAAAARAAGRRAWRTERLEYVEGAARKHLENVRGLDLGPGGEVRDGEWQGEGRNLARGEVEGLETVVAAIGGNEGPNPAQNPARDEDEMDES
ncbi:hypothetical protein RB595_005815 [Gaeumannomyces hyphopodioides]